jgi:hypothetical protein
VISTQQIGLSNTAIKKFVGVLRSILLYHNFPKSKNSFCFGQSKFETEFPKNRAGGEPHPRRKKNFNFKLKKSRTKAPNTLGGDKRRARKNRRKRKKLEYGAYLQPSSNLFPKKSLNFCMRLLPRQFATGFKIRKIFLHFFQKFARPQKRKRVENFEVFELRWKAEAEAV